MSDQQKVNIAALLHDVGKIGIEDQILKKPGQLTDEEAFHLTGPATTLIATVPMQLPLDGVVTEVPVRFVHHHQPGHPEPGRF